MWGARPQAETCELTHGCLGFTGRISTSGQDKDHPGWGSDNRLPVLQWEDLGTSLGGGATSGRPQDPELGSAFSGLNLRQPSRPTSSVTISEHEAAQAQVPFPLPMDPGMLPPSTAALTASQRNGTAPATRVCPPAASVKQEADLQVSCCLMLCGLSRCCTGGALAWKVLSLCCCAPVHNCTVLLCASPLGPVASCCSAAWTRVLCATMLGQPASRPIPSC